MTSRDFFNIKPMPLTKEQKDTILKKLIDHMKEAKSVIFADYQGVSVKDIKALRKLMRQEGVKFQVAKKTLMKLAAKESGYQEIPAEIIEGPVGAAFCTEDELAGARLIYQFAKKVKNLKLRGALFGGKVLSVAETNELAALPGRMELIAKFLYLVNYPVSGFVRALNAIREKREQPAQAEQPVAQAEQPVAQAEQPAQPELPAQTA